MLSLKLSLLVIPLDKEPTAYCLVNKNKTWGADPGCDGIDVGWYGTVTSTS